ncbi:kinetochore-associated Ndc80 complex subunit nuf2 [Tulasnella sp. JGI-2019a]|nr:kinetochore-associated Ndc80 complex subunit nuf2 [Tulasnella sp. JGI-2019a]KAG8999714.1 kinetochore-associated Ndc80 complex subunit nuf2 [Tulasnella sp. JGI-2019a]KAG9035024.1 kinetochore-associated Ndc80 complex subunit nuf2 [Tulasnella sp. JGI-2019a]
MEVEFDMPILTPNETKDMLSDYWGLSIPNEELNKPSAHTVQAIYDEFLWDMMGLRLQDLEGARINIMSEIEHPDLFTEGMRLRMFFHLVRYLLNRAGLKHFSLQDISRPDGMRLRKILSIIRNLLAFKTERTDFMEFMIRKMEDAKVRDVELAAEEEELQKQYDQLLRQRRTEEAKIPAAKDRNEELRALCAKEAKAYKTASDKSSQSKKEAQAIRDRFNNISAEQVALKQRNDNAQKRIVHSPDRVKRTIADLSVDVERERASADLNRSKARDYQAKLTQLTNIEQDLRTVEGLLVAIKSEKSRVELCTRELLTVRSHFNNRTIEFRELTTKAEQLQRQLTNAHDKFKRLEESSAEKREAASLRMQSLKEKHSKVEKQRGEMLAEHDLLRKDIEQIEQEKAEFVKTNEKALNELMIEYWTLRHSVDDYVATTATKFGLPMNPEVMPKTVKVEKKKGKSKKP